MPSTLNLRQTVRLLAVEIETRAVEIIDLAKGTPIEVAVRRRAIQIIEQSLALCSAGGPAA